jgi:spore maturation protein CgeB
MEIALVSPRDRDTPSLMASSDPDTGIRVVVLGDSHADSFAENIEMTLAGYGLPVTLVDPRLHRAWPVANSRSNRLTHYLDGLSRKIDPVRHIADIPTARALAAADPDLVLSTDGYLTPTQVARWRRLTPRATWALWYPDCLANLSDQVALVADWDHLFFKDTYLVDLLRTRTRLPAHYLPEACNPLRHRSFEPPSPDERIRYGCDVTLAGNIYPYRARIIETLPEQVSVKLHGDLPRLVADARVRSAFTGLYVTDREKALAYTCAKIVLNTLHYAEVNSVNARLFEATGCGGFVVTHANRDLVNLFCSGQEVVAVDSLPELHQAILHYVTADEERARIAKAAQQRAHREHTYLHRLQSLFETCGLRL